MRGVVVSILVLAVGFAFGARVRSGLPGVVLLIVLSALWGVAYAGIAISIAVKSKNVQTTNASFLIFFPLLFLTPNFVPFELLTPPLRVVARINPVSYVIQGLRDLVLYPNIHWGHSARAHSPSRSPGSCSLGCHYGRWTTSPSRHVSGVRSETFARAGRAR